MSGDLARRLRYLRRHGSSAHPAAGTAASRNAVGRDAAGDVNAAAGQGAAATAERAPILSDDWKQIAPLVFRRTVTTRFETLPGRRLSVPGRGAFTSRLLGRETTLDDLLFIDTETTGLSGGAGTTVFLVGAGRFDGNVVTVTQTLLADFPGEPDYLGSLLEDLGGDGVWVSYNGKAFDSRLLEGRFLLNGIPFERPEQLDLLYWARRVWRARIPDCSLSSVENYVLGVHRTGDIPGFEIPDRYFAFLRSGDGSVLTDVFDHHHQDIVSLVLLFLRLEDVLRTPLSARGIDRYQLGRWLLVEGVPEADELLRRVVEKPQSHEDTDARRRAAEALATAYRRRGDWENMERMCRAACGMGSIVAAVQLAKIYEHQSRDPEAAREVIVGLIEQHAHLAADPLIRRRLDRLEGKLGDG